MMTTPKYHLHYLLSGDDRLRSALGELDDDRLAAVLDLAFSVKAARDAAAEAAYEAYRVESYLRAGEAHDAFMAAHPELGPDAPTIAEVVGDLKGQRDAFLAADDGWDDGFVWELGSRPAAAVYASDQAYRAMLDPFAGETEGLDDDL